VSNEFLRLCDVSTVEEIGDPAKGFWANKDEADIRTNRERLSSIPTGHINEEIEPFIFVKSSGARLSFNVKSKWILNPAGAGRLLITSFEDVTAIEEQGAQLDHLKKTAELYLESGINAYGIQNDNFEHLYLSKAFINLTGYTVDTMPNHKDFYPDYDEINAKRRREELVKTPNGKIVHSGTHKVRTKDGNILWLSRSARWFNGISDERLLMVSFEDHTALTLERGFTQSLIEGSSALIVTQTKDGVIHSVSQAFIDLMGYERDALIGKDLIEFYHPEDIASGSAARKKFQELRQQEITIERRLIDANNQTKTFILNARASNVSSIYESILTLSDITALKAAEEQLRHLVEVDELTGLFSRRGLNRRFGFDQRYEDLGMYLIDLDHFKLVNDGYGHHAGDKLLKATANALKSQTRTDGNCFRLGGEEFAVLRPWRGWKDAHDFAENLRELIGATSIESDGRSVQRTARIGVSYFPVSGSMSEALKLADMVLREAKEQGRNCCVLADEETLAEFEERGVFIQASEVQLALERGEMEYFVQPIVIGEEHSTIGFEALIRWFLPSGELVGPIKFVDVLYQVIRQPRYAQLQLELHRQVLEQLKDYPEQYVSFNFTLEQIGYLGGARDLSHEIQSMLDHPNRQIVIELSEKALHARVNEEVLIEELSQLRTYGYKIALDDFGVESSNIQRLQNYPIGIVKIDRSLIREVAIPGPTRKMVGSLAVLLKSLELAVTVEGIETQEQADILNDFGLVIHQGYLYGKPVAPPELGIQAAE
jgi:diguanylate cyclase (GGDEF)-like protein/PAS domain S-box-containing protein